MSPSPFDRDSLWSKAKNFINRSFAALDDGDFPTAAMWAACSLELLGKSALSHKNPCLVADPTDDGTSLLIAAGLSHNHTKAKSIQAKAVFSRCKRAFQTFNVEDAERIAMARNEELHSGLMPFDAVTNQEIWWQRYWAQAIILIEAQDEDIDGFVGSKSAMTVQHHLDNNELHVKAYTARRIAEAAARWANSHASPEGAAALADYVRYTLPVYSLSFSSGFQCPACQKRGTLHGEEVISSTVDIDYEDGTAIEHIDVAPEAFECDHCGLVVDGHLYLEAAGLNEVISTERDYEPQWDDYGND